MVVVPRQRLGSWRLAFALFLLLRWAFEGVEEWVKMMGGTSDEAALIIYHAQETLEFLERSRWWHLLDRFDAGR